MKTIEERIKEIEEIANIDPYIRYHNQHIDVAIKSLSIIKEQQEEIEKLKEDYRTLYSALDVVSKNETGAYNKDYSEGIKEFLEQLNKEE